MIIYICHPYTPRNGKSVATHREEALALAADVMGLYPSATVIIPHNLWYGLEHMKPSSAWLECCIEIVWKCDAIACRLGVDPSQGMADELAAAEAKGMQRIMVSPRAL